MPLKSLTLTFLLSAALLAPARAQNDPASTHPERAASKKTVFTPKVKAAPAEGGAGSSEAPALRLQVEAEYEGMKRAADFVVNDAVQSNYVEGGEKAFHIGGKGIEYKKFGFIVNCLPAINPNEPDKVDVQIQLEVSGPSEDGMDIRTWQIQTELTVVKGKKTVISRGAGKAALTVTEASAP